MTVADKPITTDIYGQPVEPKPGDNYINHSKGILSWALTLDHKRIGLMYLVGVLGAFAIGGFFAIFLRTMLLFSKDSNVKNPDAIFNGGVGTAAWNDFYNQAFTLHGAIMVFMFIIPAIPAVLGNFALPLQLGAKDVAFPRLNLLSFYCWLGGSALLAVILFGGMLAAVGVDMPEALNGLDTGWTFYTPYSTSTKTGVVLATLGAFILGFSSILTGLNFIATMHMLKPKGMGWFNMPLFLWAIYATAVIQVLATPVLAITLLLLMAENLIGIGVFDPKLGGDPVLFQHFFWFYSHPAVYIMILPGLGVVSEIISTFSRKHVFGYKFIAYSSVAIALFGFIVWGHHMFTSGQSPMINAVFSLLTMSVAIPSAIKVFNWLATMYHGKIRVETPMLYAMGFIWLFTIGGLTGLFLAALSTDVYFHDTYFVVAHFHYVMVGSTLFAFLGGMYYWFPKMFGRMYNERWGKIGWALCFVGFNATFFIQFIAGNKGMPRRYATYGDDFQIYHHLSTGGSYILTIGLFVVLFNWLLAKRGKRAPANPWGGNQLEWHTNSPPPHLNFDYDPVGTDPYHFHDWKYDEEIDGYVLDPEHDPSNPTQQPVH
ncbi:cbb3-type cytochrome c oxidase subunit I [Phycisphaeraceae bacterium D3-23]